MKLSTHDTERFYRIWWPLLRYVNAQCKIVPELPKVPGKETLSSEDAHQIRQALWESDSVREAFIDENPANLPAADLDIVASWQEGKNTNPVSFNDCFAFLSTPAESTGTLQKRCRIF